MPSQLEPLVKDLWALWLPLLYEDWKHHGKGWEDDPTYPADGQHKEISSQRLEHADASHDDKSKDPRVIKGSPSITDSLLLCYMALMLLRVPLSLGQLAKYMAFVSLLSRGLTVAVGQ